MNHADLLYAQDFHDRYGAWPQSPPLDSWWRMDYPDDHPGARQDPEALREAWEAAQQWRPATHPDR